MYPNVSILFSIDKLFNSKVNTFVHSKASSVSQHPIVCLTFFAPVLFIALAV